MAFFTHSTRCELYISHASRRRYVIPKCFRSRTTNDTGSEHEMATRRGGGVTFSVDAHSARIYRILFFMYHRTTT